MTIAVIRRFLRAGFGLRVWAMMLYGLLGLPLGLLGVLYLVAAALTGCLLTPLARWSRPVSALLAWVLRGLPNLARMHRALANGLLGCAIEAPRASRPGIANPDSWRTILYLALKLPVHYVAFWFCVAFWVWAPTLVCFPLWWGAVPSALSEVYPLRGHPPLDALGVALGRWPGSLLVTLVGLLACLVTPSTSRVILFDGVLARILLGPSVAQRLRATRTVAVDGSAAQLRRIERDLHDGAQAQLVALAMRLGMAREELGAGDAAAALALVEAAHTGAKEALSDLRNLTRGIHPPVLDDGLAAALETLAARSAVPVDLWFTLGRRPSPAIETIAYFSVAELLTNVAKHSGAGHVVVLVEQVGARRLRLLVCDDGVGGARTDGTGLTGLAERVGAVDGRVDVNSPPGGPTVVTVELPVSA